MAGIKSKWCFVEYCSCTKEAQHVDGLYRCFQNVIPRINRIRTTWSVDKNANYSILPRWTESYTPKLELSNFNFHKVLGDPYAWLSLENHFSIFYYLKKNPKTSYYYKKRTICKLYYLYSLFMPLSVTIQAFYCRSSNNLDRGVIPNPIEGVIK